MSKTDHFQVHEAARIRSGKWADFVGTVTDQVTREGRQERVRVKFEGVKDGEPVSGHLWFKRSQIGRNHG